MADFGTHNSLASGTYVPKTNGQIWHEEGLYVYVDGREVMQTSLWDKFKGWIVGLTERSGAGTITPPDVRFLQPLPDWRAPNIPDYEIEHGPMPTWMLIAGGIVVALVVHQTMTKG